ncbi:MAG: glycosyltransferase [Planctomycetes bacterium]|nr:glycosyltransferase [Planctomycetota bacterium]
MNRIRVCQVVASINRNTGGPALSVSRLAVSLAMQGVDSLLAALDYGEHGPSTATENVKVLSVPAKGMTRRLRGRCPAFRRELGALVRDGVEVVHNHGLWMFPNLYARQAAVAAGVPLVISARGMTDEWSLSRSRLKKVLAWRLHEKGNLAAARLFHATSGPEAASLRSLGLRQPIAVIPNGVDLPEPATEPGRDVLERRFPALAGKRWLLFLSRLHPKKGVGELLSVWGQLAPRFPGWHLLIVGPDLDGYGDVARRDATTRGISDRVTFTGMLAGIEKECAFAHALLFVLPTHSENFGLVVAESLAYGVPVVTTKGAPWRDLVHHRCGWWIDLSSKALSATLTEAIQCPEEERRAMGARGRELMERKYSWAKVATEMKSAYLWLCGKGPRPACVQTA